MRAERLFRVLGLADAALVEEALEVRRRRTAWKRWGALAACLGLVAGLGFGWLVSGGFRGYGMSGATSGGSGGDGVAPGNGYGGVEEGTAF